jgi:hypothetical protein
MAYVKNPAFGGPGGTEFRAFSINKKVRKIDLWSENDGGGIVGLQVTFTDNSEAMHGRRTDNHRFFEFEDDDFINDIFISSGQRLAEFQFSTYSGKVFKFGSGFGSGKSVDIGTGELLGFWGRCGDELDAAGPVFRAKKPLERTFRDGGGLKIV